MKVGDITTWRTANGTKSGEVVAGNETDGFIVKTENGRVVVIGGTKYSRKKKPLNITDNENRN